MSTPSFEVMMICQNGWWTAVCAELQISGYGETEDEAKKAFERSFTSTMLTRLRASFSEPIEEETTSRIGPSLPALELPRGAQVNKRTRIRFDQVAV